MIEELGSQARKAAQVMARASALAKNAALTKAAHGLLADQDRILKANSGDMDQAVREGISGALLDRLRLTEARLTSMASGLSVVAGLPDPVGQVTAGFTRPNGLRMTRTRVPLGVVAVIYEARPNVTADAAGLCLKAGNAALLRGSSFALRSNLAIGRVIRDSLEQSDLPADAVQVVEDSSREGARALMQATEWVDLLVPRGGPQLIAAIEAEATVPYVIDGAGNCHIFVDASADLDMAADIVLNSKISRPGVCNAAEKLLVHRDIAEEFLPRVAKMLTSAGVELRGDEAARSIVDEIARASDQDWSTEYLDLIMAVKVVDGAQAALDHIRRYGSGHTEAIVTADLAAAEAFIAQTDSAVVMVNASTRFTDGEEFGFGGEIGISTQKLHVRGPMGLESLTSERWVVRGEGQVR
ncbi:MAG TPA: glutamate-5-semialdehyde dehydrogenase [Acidimicrobiia bacterium]|jgi:glutamate-5-semialdehyde dehydrogenase|nr:glutamate-5-semialdehyde dehydrogenase [Acidimicrobiia bacterium]